MDHSPAADRPARPAPAEWFTGAVEMVPLVEAPAPARLRAVRVTFQPGARTNWHTHPLGQTIYCLSGRGRAQREGAPVVEFGPGDVVVFAPGERHWHGATPDAEMCHVAMQEADESGRHVAWAEPVSEADYLD